MNPRTGDARQQRYALGHWGYGVVHLSAREVLAVSELSIAATTLCGTGSHLHPFERPAGGTVITWQVRSMQRVALHGIPGPFPSEHVLGDCSGYFYRLLTQFECASQPSNHRHRVGWVRAELVQGREKGIPLVLQLWGTQAN